ncbi:MAG: hypothetical protein NC222_01780 [Staphylococcus sp.]|nr:hypothetical protein [Staphylococcus sp.]
MIVHSDNGFKYEGTWDTPQTIELFDIWKKSSNEVVKWELSKKTLYIIIE